MSELNMRLTQENFDKLVESLNHKMTNMEVDIKWLKKITGWQVAIITGIFITLLGLLIRS